MKIPPRLISKLLADKDDEAEAIKGYGQRQQEAEDEDAPEELEDDLEEIQDDEKDHHKTLSQSLKGLKAAAKSK